MPFPIQTNPDLPLSWRRPGTYISINLNNPGSAPGVRLLLMGEQDSSAQRAANSLYRANAESDVVGGAGANSVLRAMYNSVITQVGAGTCEVWIGQTAENGAGTAATHQHKIIGTPTGSGMITWLFCGKSASVGFASTDTPTTIGTALAAAATAAFNTLPVTSVASVAGLITMTLKQKAAWGEDMPSQFYVTPGKGVSIGHDFVFTSNAVGAGTAQITVGRNTFSFVLAGGETPTQIAAGLAALIVGDGPLAIPAATPVAGDLTVIYQNDYPIHRVAGKIITSTGTTITVNTLAPVAAGTNAPAGISGSGVPSVTTLVANIDAQGVAFKAWAPVWNDAATLGALDSTLENEGGGGGGQQRGQTLNAGSTDALATAGAIPPATSPALTASVRGRLFWVAMEAANPAWQFTARIAASQAVNGRPNRNFNGLILKSSSADPLIGPSSAASISPPSDINSAINTYFMAPVVWNPQLGSFIVEHARTTSNSQDRRLHKWSLIHQLDAQRDYIRTAINAAMTTADGTGVSLMISGNPFSEGIVTLADFEDIVYRCTVEMEKLGFYDGADALKSGIKAVPNQSDPGRIDIIYTASALVDVDQVSMVANRGSIAA